MTVQRQLSVSSSVVLVLVLAAVLPSAFVRAISDYCAENTFSSNSSWLQFTKEVSTNEYAMSNKFKSLHCCAKGYRSIEWLKGNKTYPWPGGVSNLILYPESGNQTIYAQSLSLSDAGSYTCRASNDTHQSEHSVRLSVIDSTSGYTGPPLATFAPAQDATVALGGDARMFCEAFVGRISLPDVRAQVSWRRDDVSGDDVTDRMQQSVESREEDQVLGSRLLIRNVRREDFGRYVCSISNTWFQVTHFHVLLRETDGGDGGDDAATARGSRCSRTLLAVGGAAFAALAALAVLYARYGLDLRRRAKDAFGRAELDDGKTVDAVVCFHDSDAEFVMDALLPPLQRYHYACAAQRISSSSHQWWAELSAEASRGRRLLAVVTPSLCQDSWSREAVERALLSLLALHPNVVCITLQTLPSGGGRKPGDGARLSRLARQARALRFAPGAAFWSALRLRLPPRRSQHQQPVGSSSDSLEVLV